MCRTIGTLVVVVAAFILVDLASCRHDPFFDNPIPGGGDSSSVDTSQLDTTMNEMSDCDPDSVYFNRDILPFIISSCATSGCHDEVTHEEGLRLVDYDRIVRIVRAGKPENSALYEVITEDRSSKRMPPPPRAALSADQIGIIRKWIEQGAQNLECTSTGNCDTLTVSFGGFIMPLINKYCVGCHGTINPGAGIQLMNYSQIQNVAVSGRLYGAVAGLSGYAAMPQGSHLDACTINRIRSWIKAGTPNN